MKRNDFIKLNAGILSGLVLGRHLFNDEETTELRKIKKFGIQLYTLRDVLPSNPEGILKQLASFGYKQIESYEGPNGMFWGMGPKGFKQKIEDLGMKLVSSHCDAEKEFEKKAAEGAEAGLTYLVQASERGGMNMEDYKRFADDCNRKGEICRSKGIKFAFHNHDKSFKIHDGTCGQEILLKNTDPASVFFEMDIYWVIAGGQDPIQWLTSYPGRFKLSHVKDRTKNPGNDNGKNSTDLGEGTIDFGKILETARKNGMEYFLVEQEFYPNGTSLEAARTDAAYMRKLKI